MKEKEERGRYLTVFNLKTYRRKASSRIKNGQEALQSRKKFQSRTISYEGLSVAAAEALKTRPFNFLAVRALTIGSLMRFLTKNKQDCKNTDGKRRLVWKCREFIECVELHGGVKPVKTSGVLPHCMVCARPYKGEYAMSPCGHIGCCALCCTKLMQSRVQQDVPVCGLYQPPLPACPVCKSPSTFLKLKFV